MPEMPPHNPPHTDDPSALRRMLAWKASAVADALREEAQAHAFRGRTGLARSARRAASHASSVAAAAHDHPTHP